LNDNIVACPLFFLVLAFEVVLMDEENAMPLAGKTSVLGKAPIVCGPEWDDGT